MILVDTGPLVALFDPADSLHQDCGQRLRAAREPLITTVPVLTEAFYMLNPRSHGGAMLRAFIDRAGLGLWFFDASGLARSFELMEEYARADFADASLLAAAESLRTRKIMTLDRRDFAVYRVRLGHQREHIEIV